MELRYMGFDQQRNTRRYRFDGLSKGSPTAHFVVTADIALFLAHRIGIQEGPSLCARKLSQDLEGHKHGAHELTAEDLLSFTKARKAAEERKAEARKSAFKRRAD
jgi:hypothetical protein